MKPTPFLHFARSGLRRPAVALAFVFLPLGAYATTILSDDFSSATYAGTSGTVGTGRVVSASTYYSTYTNAAGGPVVLQTDNTAPLAGNGLFFTGYGSIASAVASFNTVDLGLGQFITFSINYRSNTGTGGIPALGLYNNGGTPFTANLFGELDRTAASSELHGDKGYNFYKTLGSATNDLTIASEAISQWKPQQFRPVNSVSLQNTSSGLTGGDTAVHSLSLTIARQLNGDLSITATYDNFSTNVVVLAKDVLTTSFNELAFSGNGESRFDNLLITTGSSIPEPAATGLYMGGFFLMVAGLYYRRARRGRPARQEN